HENIGLIDQRKQRLARGGLFKVQHKTALVSIDTKKYGGQPRVEGRACMARGVAAGRFDLDDIGAVVSQYLRRIRAENDRCQVEDADAAQGSRGGSICLHGMKSLFLAPDNGLILFIYQAIIKKHGYHSSSIPAVYYHCSVWQLSP